jgi:2-C-methyl-D-erythritol 2,4-cyclodiphosphate synthase
MTYKTGIGQDSHRFLSSPSEKKCTIAGLIFEGVPGLDADSDGDVIFHAICNAISSITHVPILGKVAIELCHKHGITNSRIYLEKALETLGNHRIEHIALTIEGKRPKFQERIQEMRVSIAGAMNLQLAQIGITVTSGDELTAFGRGEGLQCLCVITLTIQESCTQGL